MDSVDVDVGTEVDVGVDMDVGGVVGVDAGGVEGMEIGEDGVGEEGEGEEGEEEEIEGDTENGVDVMDEVASEMGEYWCPHLGCRGEKVLGADDVWEHVLSPLLHLHTCPKGCPTCLDLIEEGVWKVGYLEAEQFLTCPHVGCSWRSSVPHLRGQIEGVARHLRSFSVHRKHVIQMHNLKCPVCIELFSSNEWTRDDIESLPLLSESRAP